jgi:hypothetical protein
MPARKHMTEFAINMHLAHTMVLQQDDLKRVGEYNYFTTTNPCHIYLICRRPRILIDIENFKVDVDVVRFAFKIQKQDTFENLEIEIPNNFGTTDLKLFSSYPNNNFEFTKMENAFFGGNQQFYFISLAPHTLSILI